MIIVGGMAFTFLKVANNMNASVILVLKFLLEGLLMILNFRLANHFLMKKAQRLLLEY